MKRENRPLGRGLDNLLGEASGTSSINEVNIDSIQPNPDQPRRAFDEESLAELALSIQSIGLVQPITLKQLQDGTYLIISGERRWRACKRAGSPTSRRQTMSKLWKWHSSRISNVRISTPLK